MDYNRKIDFAVKLLQSIPQDGTIEVSYSGGKDSDVILELAKMAGIPFEAIYKNTTIDPPGTIAHAREMGARIVQPKKSFFEVIESKGVPSRFRRFCCSELKEYKIHDRAIQGIRRCESTKRAERYKEPEFCRLYPKGEKVRIYLPILEWTNEDVERFIKERGIKCAPVYYNEQGEFCVERRLGCIGCPLACMNQRRQEFKKYPKMLRAWIKAAQKYFDTHPQARLCEYFEGDVYAKFFCDLFFEGVINKYMEYKNDRLFPMEKTPKQFLEEYFNIDLTV